VIDAMRLETARMIDSHQSRIIELTAQRDPVVEPVCAIWLE
jgi:hypothetical protein